MDTATLVGELKDEGEKLLDRLKRAGVEVAVAAWVHKTYDGQWYFYIATPIVEKDGQHAAYQQVFAELAECQFERLSHFDIRIIGSQDPMAIDAIQYQHSNLGTNYGGRTLGKMIIDDAYIYPK